MKTLLVSTLVLAATMNIITSLPLTAASFAPAKAYQVGAVERYGATVIRPGDSATKVAAFLGRPDQRLSGDTWVYRKFQSKRDPGQSADCTILVVTFRNERVAELQKVNDTAVQVIAGLVTPPAAPRIIAEK